jgi:hypothetical protein
MDMTLAEMDIFWEEAKVIVSVFSFIVISAQISVSIFRD